ncbi:MAG: hypothetical protein AAFR23_05770 [Pseudomonadota bacterium]
MVMRICAPLAAVMGIGGVLLYAAAAHAGDGPGSQSQFSISTGALMLMTHAPVIFGIGLVSMAGGLRRLGWIGAALLLAVGNAVFAASVSLHYLTDPALTSFIGLGPTSAFMIIAGWVFVAVLGLAGDGV